MLCGLTFCQEIRYHSDPGRGGTNRRQGEGHSRYCRYFPGIYICSVTLVISDSHSVPQELGVQGPSCKPAGNASVSTLTVCKKPRNQEVVRRGYS